MSRFLNPFPQFLKLQSGALQPNSSGYLTFYVNGTSTLASIWTDATLTTLATNPQQLDAEGRMTQNVFINTDLYRVKLTDSNGATIWDKSYYSVADTSTVDALIAELEALIATITSDLYSNNYALNPGMSVDNAATASSPVTLSTSYQDTVTSFASAVTGNVSAGTALQSTTQIGKSGYSLKYSGVTCTSAGVPSLRFRIQSQDAISLSNKTLTISLVVKHNVGSAVNYTITPSVANSADNFSSVTATGITSTTSVATGTATTISVTGAFADVSNGLQVIVSCAPNQSLTTKDFYWSDVQVNIAGVLLPFRPPLYKAEQILAAPSVSVPVRQTVLQSSIDSNGFPNFISAGTGLVANIAATSINVILTAASGANLYGQVDRVGIIRADTTIPGLTNTATNYLYADIDAAGAVTLGATTTAPVYQMGGTYSTTSGAFTFNIQAMTGKVGNGSSADVAYRVFIGEAVTSGGSVTSVVNYALMGRYQSAAVALGASTAIKSFSHNIGVRQVNAHIWLKNVTADYGYVTGDIVEPVSYPTGGFNSNLAVQLASRNAAQYVAGAAGTCGLAIQSIGASPGTNQDIANTTYWNVFMTAERPW